MSALRTLIPPYPLKFCKLISTTEYLQLRSQENVTPPLEIIGKDFYVRKRRIFKIFVVYYRYKVKL